jgi:hypothetical protein
MVWFHYKYEIPQNFVQRLYGEEYFPYNLYKDNKRNTRCNIHIGFPGGVPANEGRPKDGGQSSFGWYSLKQAMEYLPENTNYPCACLIRITTHYLNAGPEGLQIEKRYFIGWANKGSRNTHGWEPTIRQIRDNEGMRWKLSDNKWSTMICGEESNMTFLTIIDVATRFRNVPELAFSVLKSAATTLKEVNQNPCREEVAAVERALRFGAKIVERDWNPDIFAPNNTEEVKQ